MYTRSTQTRLVLYRYQPSKNGKRDRPIAELAHDTLPDAIPSEVVDIITPLERRALEEILLDKHRQRQRQRIADLVGALETSRDLIQSDWVDDDLLGRLRAAAAAVLELVDEAIRQRPEPPAAEASEGAGEGDAPKLGRQPDRRASPSAIGKSDAGGKGHPRHARRGRVHPAAPSHFSANRAVGSNTTPPDSETVGGASSAVMLQRTHRDGALETPPLAAPPDRTRTLELVLQEHVDSAAASSKLTEADVTSAAVVAETAPWVSGPATPELRTGAAPDLQAASALIELSLAQSSRSAVAVEDCVHQLHPGAADRGDALLESAEQTSLRDTADAYAPPAETTQAGLTPAADVIAFERTPADQAALEPGVSTVPEHGLVAASSERSFAETSDHPAPTNDCAEPSNPGPADRHSAVRDSADTTPLRDTSEAKAPPAEATEAHRTSAADVPVAEQTAADHAALEPGVHAVPVTGLDAASSERYLAEPSKHQAATDDCAEPLSAGPRDGDDALMNLADPWPSRDPADGDASLTESSAADLAPASDVTAAEQTPADSAVLEPGTDADRGPGLDVASGKGLFAQPAGHSDVSCHGEAPLHLVPVDHDDAFREFARETSARIEGGDYA